VGKPLQQSGEAAGLLDSVLGIHNIFGTGLGGNPGNVVSKVNWTSSIALRVEREEA